MDQQRSNGAPEATLITGVDVIDGTGAPRYRADVLLRGGVIESIDPAGGEATTATMTPAATAGGEAARGTGPDAVGQVIDGAGLVLTPGFIDMHAHSDLQILLTPEHEAKLNQGVTTEVLGQDGLSYAPITPEVLAVVRQKIGAWNDDPSDRTIGWASVREYLDELDAAGIATNAAYLIPHGVVRAIVMGFEPGPASPEQIEAMAQVVRQGMLDGAVGLSAGLTYTPGMYASDAELAPLLRVVAEHGGYFCPHTRSYGKGALESYAAMIALARESGVALHLTHATMNFGENEGRAGEFLALIDAALEDGVDITLDTYPYLPGATTLSAVLPSWASAGSTDDVLARLNDPALLGRLREDMDVRGSDGCHGVTVDYATLEISGVREPGLNRLVGRTVASVAQERGEEPFLTALWIMREDRLGTGILQHVGHEDNVRAIMAHRVHTGGSDGILVGAKPHPRAWATYPRYLGHYVRELGVMGLEEMVHHLTGRAAARLNLLRRGLVRAGYAADVVLLDPATIADRATFAQPRQRAAGVRGVWVNGALAYDGGRTGSGDDGAVTGARAGRALRHSAFPDFSTAPHEETP